MRDLLRFPGQRGVVLPIVLVVLVVVTMLIVTQVRRGTVDERLAGNWSRAISQQTSADSLLRYCEARILRSSEVRHWRNVVRSENYLVTPAWNSNLPLGVVLPLAVDILPPGASGGVCVIEDATTELGGNTYQESARAGSDGVRDPYLWKYRFTIAVTFPDSTSFGSITQHTQSEVRFVVP